MCRPGNNLASRKGKILPSFDVVTYWKPWSRGIGLGKKGVRGGKNNERRKL